ncbi:2-hydroxyacid dehydrogenase [Sporosarcina cascadiensis]|uniref:2-hydroxyacid dehydrogenase n=1 Tax=Sporosarcina cascadiensis TaxID=2660747 RepID=UPI00129BBF05|nr:D-glycerate dehydrogenase [Sporosarcina cascadiensis]
MLKELRKPKVLITRYVPGNAVDRLKEIAEVEMNMEDRDLSRKELLEKIQDKDGIISVLSDKIDREFLESATKLKVVANYAVGFNNIDIQEAKKRNVMVTNTPDVLTEATADMTWTLLLAVSRRVIDGDRFIRQGDFIGWTPTLLLGSAVSNKTIGILGMGRIGQAVAERAAGFGMKILYYNRTRLGIEAEKDLQLHYVSKEDLLKQSDFVSLHVPYNSATHYLIDKDELDLMKKTAFLINTSRGPLVNETELAKALDENRIAGAGLDVFEEEPKVSVGLMKSPLVTMTPHVGSGTLETREKMTELAVENMISVLSGKEAITPVW